MKNKNLLTTQEYANAFIEYVQHIFLFDLTKYATYSDRCMHYFLTFKDRNGRAIFRFSVGDFYNNNYACLADMIISICKRHIVSTALVEYMDSPSIKYETYMRLPKRITKLLDEIK